MQADTADADFLHKRRVEMELEASEEVSYYSKYSLVTFREDYSYSEALRLGRAQDEAILELLKEGALLEEQSTADKYKIIQERVAILLRD